jgi:integrase/recombinase XerD
VCVRLGCSATIWNALRTLIVALHSALYSGRPNDHGHDDAPFCDERNRYLRHCAEHRAAPAVLKIKCNELLWIAGQLDRDARQGVGMDVLGRIALKWQSLHGAVTAVRRVVDIGRPWLRFLGSWREPNPVFQ